MKKKPASKVLKAIKEKEAAAKREVYSFRLPVAVMEQVKNIARQNKTSASAIVEELLAGFCEDE